MIVSHSNSLWISAGLFLSALSSLDTLRVMNLTRELRDALSLCQRVEFSNPDPMPTSLLATDVLGSLLAASLAHSEFREEFRTKAMELSQL